MLVPYRFGPSTQHGGWMGDGQEAGPTRRAEGEQALHLLNITVEHTISLSPALIPSLSLCPALIHPLSLSLYPALIHSPAVSLSLSHSHTYTYKSGVTNYSVD